MESEDRNMDVPIILAASHHMMVAPIKDMFAQTQMPPGIQFVVKTPSDMRLKPLPDWSDVNEVNIERHAHRVAQRVWCRGFCAMADCTRLSVENNVSTLTTVVAFIDCVGTAYFAAGSLAGSFRDETNEVKKIPLSTPMHTFVPCGQNSKKHLAFGEMGLEIVATVSHWGKAYRKVLTDHKFKILKEVLNK